MFGLFKKDSVKGLTKKYDKLMEQSFHLSKTNRKLADQKYAEAEAIMNQIQGLKNG